MRVLSSLKASPLGSSHSTSCALTWWACRSLKQQATRSSAYLTKIGESRAARTSCADVAA